MLVKTDLMNASNFRKAKITLQCMLERKYYSSIGSSRSLDLHFIAESIRDIEFDVNDDGRLTVTLASAVPVGYSTDEPDWLVVNIVENGAKHEGPGSWEDFIAKITARIILHLTDDNYIDHIATVELDDGHAERGSTRQFVVMDNTGGVNQSVIYI